MSGRTIGITAVKVLCSGRLINPAQLTRGPMSMSSAVFLFSRIEREAQNQPGIHGIRARQMDHVCWCGALRFLDGGTLLACARVALLWFLVYEKNLLLTNDAAGRGGYLTRGPGHLMVSGDICLSLSYLGATVSVLEQKTVSSFVVMRGG